MVKVAHHFRRKKSKLAFKFLLSSCSKRKDVAFSLEHLLHITMPVGRLWVLRWRHCSLTQGNHLPL